MNRDLILRLHQDVIDAEFDRWEDQGAYEANQEGVKIAQAEFKAALDGACNAHDELVAALRDYFDYCAGGDIPGHIHEAGRAALAKVQS